ncbi:hypothetical protein [Cribrihabitans pelagius]|uniref:hypothetical protein n=1 Tax=Cribrihabitans pelagius TaxID=1765746 RepID=UPI003B5A7D42
MALTNREAQIVLGMLARGDKHHDIAAWFGENQARVAEVIEGSHGSLSAAPEAELFPKGSPGPKSRRLRGFVNKAIQALEDGDATKALDELKSGLFHFNKPEA